MRSRLLSQQAFSTHTQEKHEMLKRLPLIALVLLVGMSGAAHAEFYVGAAYLNSSVDIEAGEDFSTDQGGWKILAGYNFFKFLGGELSYRDFGSISDSVEDSSIKGDLTSFDIAARGVLPLGIFRPFVKVGYSNLSADFTFDDSINDPENSSDSEWELQYGIGLDVNISKISLRLEYEKYDIDDSLDSIALGAYWRF